VASDLQTLISLDHLHCHDETDDYGGGEPYLWAAFFKVDGETVVLDLVEDDRPDENKTLTDLFLKGGCTLVATAGSHGDLPNHDVDAGEDVPIPAAIGESRFAMVPIQVTERARKVLPDRNTSVNGGAVGVVVALLEQNQVSELAAEAGHAVFNDTLVVGINEMIPTLKFPSLSPPPEQLAALKVKVSDAATAAIVKTSGLDPAAYEFPDAKIGAEFFHVEFGLTPWQDLEIAQRMQRVIMVSEPPLVRFPPLPPHYRPVIAGDYTLFGEILGVEPSPLGYTALRRSAEFGTPPAVGAPAACFVAPLGVRNIVYRDTDGRLHELWQDVAGLTGTANLTEVIGGPTASGNPFLYVDTVAGQLLVLYRGTDGHVHCLYTGGHDDLSGAAGAPNAVGDPVGTFNSATNINHVAYRGVDGQLHVLYWTAAEDRPHYEGPLRDSLGQAPPPAGDPSMFFDGRGTNLVVYRGNDHHIHSIYWSTDEAGHDALSGFAGTPTANGEPVAHYIPELDLTQIIYRGNDDRLYEIYSAGEAPAQGWDLTAWVPGAPLADSDPAVYYMPADNSSHVIYRSSDNHLHELSWIQGQTPTHVDLTVAGLARRAVDQPAAFTAGGPISTQHVIYRSTDNEIREIRWPTP
jgi:hypothetical protein